MLQILLGESDSFLNEGTAKIVIIHVTLDSGKKVQFPFPADNPISEIYKAVAKISEEKIAVPVVSSVPSHVADDTKGAGVSLVSSAPSFLDGEIHKECLVKCVKVEPRGDGATIDIEVGKIYRVLAINGPTSPEGKKFAMNYDLIDDNAPTPMRIFALPHEVIFYQKRKPPTPKSLGKKGKSGKCGVCSEDMVFYKEEDGRFLGTCLACTNKTELIDAKPTVAASVENVKTGTGTPVPASV